MNRIKTVAMAAAIALSSAGTASAQTGADDPQHSDGRNARQNGSTYVPGMREADKAAAQTTRANGYAGSQPPHQDDGRGGDAQRDWRAYGYEHRWQRGDRLPADYRSSSYVVEDWRGHHLSAPPRGYHWVQQGSDYLLVAIATGVIASVLLSQ